MGYFTGHQAFFAQVQKEGNREVKRSIEYCNLDMIISIGYRVLNHKMDLIKYKRLFL